MSRRRKSRDPRTRHSSKHWVSSTYSSPDTCTGPRVSSTAACGTWWVYATLPPARRWSAQSYEQFVGTRADAWQLVNMDSSYDPPFGVGVFMAHTRRWVHPFRHWSLQWALLLDPFLLQKVLHYTSILRLSAS